MENRCRKILLLSQFLSYKHGISSDYKTQLDVRDVFVLYTVSATECGIINTIARMVTKGTVREEFLSQ